MAKMQKKSLGSTWWNTNTWERQDWACEIWWWLQSVDCIRTGLELGEMCETPSKNRVVKRQAITLGVLFLGKLG